MYCGYVCDQALEDIRPMTGTIVSPDRKMSSTLFFSPEQDFNLSVEHLHVDPSPDDLNGSKSGFSKSSFGRAFLGAPSDGSGVDSKDVKHNSGERGRGLESENVFITTDTAHGSNNKSNSSGSGQFSSLVGILDLGFSDSTINLGIKGPERNLISNATPLDPQNLIENDESDLTIRKLDRLGP